MTNILSKKEIFSPKRKYFYEATNILSKWEIFSPNRKYSQQMTNILIKKEIFSANYKYSDQKGNILIKKEKFSPVEKKEEISLSSGCSLRLLKVKPVRGEENNVDHDQENLKMGNFMRF